MANFNKNYRLQSVYNAVDRDDYDQAIKMCSRNDMKDCIEAKALLAYCYAKLGMYTESLNTALAVKSLKPVENDVLQNVSTAFKYLGSFGDICECFENAFNLHPVIDLAIDFFYSVVKVYNPAKQQQIALKLFRQFSKPQFMYWAATSAMQQAKSLTSDPNLISLSLQLCERFLLKMMKENDQEEPSSQEIELLVDCLFMQKKYLECRQYLDEFVTRRHCILLSDQRNDEESFNTTKLLKLSPTRFTLIDIDILHALGEENTCFHKYMGLIGEDNDEFGYWRGLIDSWNRCRDVMSRDELVALMSSCEDDRCAMVAMMYFLKTETLNPDSNDGGQKLVEFVLNYLLNVKFGGKLVAFDDVREHVVFIKTSSPTLLQGLVHGLLGKLSSLSSVVTAREDSLTHYLVLKQVLFLICYCPICHLHVINHHCDHDCQDFSYDDWVIAAKSEIEEIYRIVKTAAHTRPRRSRRTIREQKSSKGKKNKHDDDASDGNELVQSRTESRIEDDLMALVFEHYHDIVHAMSCRNVCIDARDELILECACRLIECLNDAENGFENGDADLSRCRYNYTIKLQLINCLSALKCHTMLFPLFSSLRIKHMQQESLSYLIIPMCLSSGCFAEALIHCQSVITFHRSCDRDNGYGIQQGFEFGNYSKVVEIYEFHQKMERSLTLARSRVSTTYLTLLLKKHTYEDSCSYLNDVCHGGSSSSLIHTTLTSTTSAYAPVLFKIENDSEFDRLSEYCDYSLFQSYTTNDHASILSTHRLRNVLDVKFRHNIIVCMRLMMEDRLILMSQVVQQLHAILSQMTPAYDNCSCVMASTNYVDHIGLACGDRVWRSIDLTTVSFLSYSHIVLSRSDVDECKRCLKQQLLDITSLVGSMQLVDVELISYLLLRFIPIVSICLQHLRQQFSQDILEVKSLVIDILDTVRRAMAIQTGNMSMLGDSLAGELNGPKMMVLASKSSSRREVVAMMTEIVDWKVKSITKH